jgi:hypothetical protein
MIELVTGKEVDTSISFGYTLGKKKGIILETIKTAISIQKLLFDQAEDLARKLKVSRSRLFVLALQEYIQREKNRELLKQLNMACADDPDAAEQTLRRSALRSHRRLVEDEW